MKLETMTMVEEELGEEAAALFATPIHGGRMVNVTLIWHGARVGRRYGEWVENDNTLALGSCVRADSKDVWAAVDALTLKAGLSRGPMAWPILARMVKALGTVLAKCGLWPEGWPLTEAERRAMDAEEVTG